MKKGLISFVIIFLVVAIIWRAIWLKKQSDKIAVTVEGVRLSKPFKLENLRTAEYSVKLKLTNFSAKSFTIDQIYTEFYNVNSNLIATQNKPIESFEIKKGQASELNLNFEAQTAKVFELASEAGLVQTLSYLIGREELGQRVKMKGFVRVREMGIPFTVEFEEWITI